ncbi:6069_t:CDS:2, partial [Dentiscutata heterogama]
HYTCEIIPSIRGNPTINVHGFIMIKDKNKRDLYYWYCEKHVTFNCGRHATTILVRGKHILRQAGGHNHAADASRAGLPSGSNSLGEFVILDDLKKTLDGSDFLIKDLAIDFSKDHNIYLQPEFVLTDFELASINALQN